MTEFNMPPTNVLLEGMAQLKDQITKAREGDQDAIDFCLQMLEMMIMTSTVAIDDQRLAGVIRDHGDEMVEILGDKMPRFPAKDEGTE